MEKNQAIVNNKIIPNILKDNKALKAIAQSYEKLSQKINEDPSFLYRIDSYGFSLLHLASYDFNANIECVILLLKKGINAWFKCNIGRNALHYACRWGHLEIVIALIQHDSSLLFDKDKDKKTPLDLAIREKHEKIIFYINEFNRQQENDINISEMRKLVLQYIENAKKYNSINDEITEIYKKLTDTTSICLKYISYLDKELLEQLLVYSCKFGYLELIRRLIQKEKIDPNCRIKEGEDAKLPLELAIQYSQKEVINFLLIHGGKITIESEHIIVTSKGREYKKDIFSALEKALILKSEVSLITLLSHGYTHKELDNTLNKEIFKKEGYQRLINILKSKIQDRNLFLDACKKNNIKEIEKLLNQDVYIDSDDLQGRNALFLAVTYGHEKAVEILLANNATISYSAYRITSIEKALENYDQGDNSFYILKLLFAKELQVELHVEDKNKPSHILAKMVTTLLYKNMRYLWESLECNKLRGIIQYFLKLYKSKLNNLKLKDEKEAYQDWIDLQSDFYGSYLSSDSDSAEESLFSSQEENEETIIDKQKANKMADVQQKTVEIEGAFYLEPNYETSTRFDRTKAIMQERMVEAKSLTDSKALMEFKKVFKDDGKNYFKSNGQLHLVGGTKKDELYPIYSGTKIKGVSPLINRSRISTSKEKKQYYVASYRGYTYITNLWNKDSRKAHRKKNELGQPLQSMAVQFEASTTSNFKDLHKYETALTIQEREEFQHRKSKFAYLIKKKLKSIKTTGVSRFESISLSDREYPGLNLINNFSYDNLSELLQVVYTTNYNLYFKLLNCEFFRNRLITSHSPFVSTAETPYHALKYAYGIKTFPGHQNETLKPRWQKNGRAERPYSGKVYVILHAIEDLKAAHRISSMLWKGKCLIPKEIAPERELSFFSFIDQDKIVYQHIAKYPSFHSDEYKNIYLYKYGMDESLYCQFKEYFNQCRKSNRLNLFTNLLAEYLCAYHEMRFVKIAESEAKKRDGALVYLDEYGEIKSDGTPATYSTPHTNLASGSPNKKYKEEILKKIVEKNKENPNYVYLINDEIFRSDQRRVEKLARLIINMKQDNPVLEELDFQYKNRKVLIKNIESIEKQYTTLLHYALVKRSLKLTKWLIELTPTAVRKKDKQRSFAFEYVNLRDRFGNTPLHIASLNKDEEIWNLLIERGADPEIINNQGLSAQVIRRGALIVTNVVSTTTSLAPNEKIKEEMKPVTQGSNNLKQFSDEELDERFGVKRLDFNQATNDKPNILQSSVHIAASKSVQQTVSTVNNSIWFGHEDNYTEIYELILNLLRIQDLNSFKLVSKLFKLHAFKIYPKKLNFHLEEELIEHINTHSNLNEQVKLQLLGIKNKLDKTYPIFIAVQISSIVCLDLLCRKKVKIDIFDNNYNTIFHYIMKKPNPAMLDILFKYYPVESFNLLLAANSEGNIALMLLNGLNSQNSRECIEKSYKLFQKYGFNQNDKIFENFIIKQNGKSIDNRIVVKLIKRQKITDIKKLLGSPNISQISTYLSIAWSDSKKRTYIHWAVACGGIKLLKCFLYPIELICNNELIFTEKGNIPLKEFVESNYKEILLHQDIDGNTPLHLAAILGNKEIAEILIKYGAYDAIDIQNHAGKTPLLIAKECEKHHPKRRNKTNISIKSYFFNKVVGFEPYFLKEYLSQENEDTKVNFARNT